MLNKSVFTRILPLAAALSMILTGCGMETITPEPAPVQTTAPALQTTVSSGVTGSASVTSSAVPVSLTTAALTDKTVVTGMTTTGLAAGTSSAVSLTAAQTTATTGVTKQYDTGEGKTRIERGIMIIHSGTDHPRALEQYQGNFPLGTRFANAVNKWKNALGSDINVWCMVPPTSYAFYKPEDVPDNNSNQLENWENIESQLKDVTGVPIWHTLNAHKDEPIYSLTDYHWQPLGAFYAAEQFSKLARVPFASLSTYEKKQREGYVGAFYWVNKISELNETKETFTYYKPDNLDEIKCTYYNTSYKNPREGNLLREDMKTSASYQIFGGTDQIILQVDTNVNNGRTLVIFKDSFGNALVPFLTHSFSKIVLCDFRFFDLNPVKFIKDVGATDMLFCINASTLMSSAKIKTIDSLVK